MKRLLLAKAKRPGTAATAPKGAGRPMLQKKKRFAPAGEGAGKIGLGKTITGKPVWASGAESGEYDDDDHGSAAHQHAKVSVYHRGRSAHHASAGEGDEKWQRGEAHHADAETHRRLSEHHETLMRHHLTAGGKSGSARLEMGEGGQPTISPVRPDTPADKARARKTLAKRTHHSHPGGVTDQDRAVYRKLCGGVDAD